MTWIGSSVSLAFQSRPMIEPSADAVFWRR